MLEAPTSHLVLEFASNSGSRAADHDEDTQQQGSGDAAELFLGVLRAGTAAQCFWRSWRLGIATRVIFLDKCALHFCEKHALVSSCGVRPLFGAALADLLVCYSTLGRCGPAECAAHELGSKSP